MVYDWQRADRRACRNISASPWTTLPTKTSRSRKLERYVDKALIWMRSGRLNQAARVQNRVIQACQRTIAGALYA